MLPGFVPGGAFESTQISVNLALGRESKMAVACILPQAIDYRHAFSPQGFAVMKQQARCFIGFTPSAIFKREWE